MTISLPFNLLIAAALVVLIGAACAPMVQTPSASEPSSPTTEQSGTTESPAKVQVQTGTSLNLSGQGLVKLPSYVLERTDLVELDVSNNELTGALPAEIRFLKKLRVLNVSRNQMTGVPAEVGQLSELRVLDLSYNNLTGLPYELGNLKNLQTLNLTGNNYAEQDLAVILKGIPNVTVIK